MPRQRLPLQALPAWTSLNNIAFSGVEVQPIQHKGHGLVATKQAHVDDNDNDVDNDENKTKDNGNDEDKNTETGSYRPPPLITIPRELVLNAEAVEQYAKEDRNFKALLDACGRKSPRHDILLFLLVQLILSSNPPDHVALSNPWTEYVKFLDDHVPVPTLWSEDQRLLLQGTSLEPALHAKMTALAREFDDVREKSTEIECWNGAFWGADLAQLADWHRVDAWYRSRVLELPISGPSLVPCIDMANHSTDANAYYEQTSDGSVVLLLRPGASLADDMEITISYGSEKSPAEMLFSYGFLDSSSAVRTLTLPLMPFPDDPLGKAKIHIFEGTPSVRITEADGKMNWASPFAYLMCLNEEDGLGFQVMQSSDGGRELRLFWQDEDVTDTIHSFETLVTDHALCDVFRLRVNMVISQRLQEQLEQLAACAEATGASTDAVSATELRQIESEVLEGTLRTLEDQKSQLLALESVTSYLKSMEPPENPGTTANNEDDEDDEDDFS